MIKPEQVPEDAAIVADRAWLSSPHEGVEQMREAIAAALNAWPKMRHVQKDPHSEVGCDPAIILPLGEPE